MKKILLMALPLLAIGFLAKAQLSYTVGADTLYTSLMDDNVAHKAKFTITNNSSTSVDFEWRMAAVDKPSDWSAPGVCDWQNCYLFGDFAWHTAPMAGNTSEELYIEMKRPSGATTGCSAIRIEYREKGQSTNEVNLLHTSHAAWSACAMGLSTNNIEKDIVTVYPNPTSNVINLNVLDKNVRTIQLSNLIGKQIQRLNINSSSAGIYQLSLQALPKGIYILQFKNESGKLLGITRITKR